MIDRILARLKSLFLPAEAGPAPQWQQRWSDFLLEKVAFYRALGDRDKLLFHQRIWLFLETTSIEAAHSPVTEDDRLLIAASAIIPVWGFPNWHYFNLKSVCLLPAAFNERFECGKSDSLITGMVGNGPMSGKMVLCRSALHRGFAYDNDRQNVGIHEFVHLIDMADGECDGYPERLREHAYSIPWFELVGRKIEAIADQKSNIRGYGATNRAEFFAVASEYFFERPKMMKSRHPLLFSALTGFYQQDVLAISSDLKIRKKSPCPCGSNKRYKRCCMPAS